MSLPPLIRDSERLLCYVTDRKQLLTPNQDAKTALLGKLKEAAGAGVDWIQIREKDLSAAELSELAREVLRCAPASCRILINDRLDVACAVGAAGVHLGERSIPVEAARRFARERTSTQDFLVGVSVHSQQAAQAAQASGADYVLFGPVFATPSKIAFGPPQGLERLADVCASVPIPVLAIGGITPENAQDCYKQGARGIAAIRLFQEATDVTGIVTELRGSKTG